MVRRLKESDMTISDTPETTEYKEYLRKLSNEELIERYRTNIIVNSGTHNKYLELINLTKDELLRRMS